MTPEERLDAVAAVIYRHFGYFVATQPWEMLRPEAKVVYRAAAREALEVMRLVPS